MSGNSLPCEIEPRMFMNANVKHREISEGSRFRIRVSFLTTNNAKYASKVKVEVGKPGVRGFELPPLASDLRRARPAFAQNYGATKWPEKTVLQGLREILKARKIERLERLKK